MSTEKRHIEYRVEQDGSDRFKVYITEQTHRCGGFTPGSNCFECGGVPGELRSDDRCKRGYGPYSLRFFVRGWQQAFDDKPLLLDSNALAVFKKLVAAYNQKYGGDEMENPLQIEELYRDGDNVPEGQRYAVFRVVHQEFHGAAFFRGGRVFIGGSHSLMATDPFTSPKFKPFTRRLELPNKGSDIKFAPFAVPLCLVDGLLSTVKAYNRERKMQMAGEAAAKAEAEKKPEPWIPKLGEQVWIVTSRCPIVHGGEWTCSAEQLKAISDGRVFRTGKEAQAAAERINQERIKKALGEVIE